MDLSGRRHRSLRWFAALVMLILLFGLGHPVLAMSFMPWGNPIQSGSAFDHRATLPTQNPSGRLKEVEPPGAVQQLRQALATHHPHLSLIGPKDGSQLKGGPINLELMIEDWPLANDSELGLGAHVAIQIDDREPIRISEGNGNRLTLQLPSLPAGSHRFTAYAAYPWGESVKAPGASLNWRLHQFRPLMGTQPDPGAPWLAMVSPAELGDKDPLLLDWLVWNAPLQNLRDGDARWRLRITVNDSSFVVDQQDALWLEGINNHQGDNTVQMELLNGIGESIDPSFNNQLRALPERKSSKAVWLKPNLTDTEMARLLGEAKPDHQNQTQPNMSPPPQPSSTLDLTEQLSAQEEGFEEGAAGEKSLNLKAVKKETASDTAMTKKTGLDEAVPDEAVPDEAVPDEAINIKEEPDSTTNTPSELPPESIETPNPEPGSTAKEPQIRMDMEQERISPTSTLGGSARELLNANGTQR